MRSPQPSPENQQLIQQYIQHLECERRYSPNTIEAVRRDMQRINIPLLTANAAQLKSILATRHADGLSARSLARMASSWRGFYRFLVHEKRIQHNPVELIKTPKAPRKLPKALGVDPLIALLSGPLPTEWKWIQTHVLIELLYATGLRIGEALSLQLTPNGQTHEQSILNMATKEIRVHGKGGKTRIVPIIDSLHQRLQTYLQHRHTQLQPASVSQSTAWLFHGNNAQALTVRQAQRNLTAYAQQKNLGQHLHPHMLRHSFGSHVLQSTQNLRAVQELLGHASLSSTQVYTALDFTHLAQVYDKAFPRAK